MQKLIMIGGVMLGLAACQPVPVDGGPCTYETSDISAEVIALNDNTAEFEGPFGAFNMRYSELGGTPEIGDTLDFSADIITEGTCTPHIYSYSGPPFEDNN